MEVMSEIGVNWSGDLELANEMIKKSKEAGADAVKFQAFTRYHLEGRGFTEEKIQTLLKSSVTQENAKELKEYSDSVGIEWFCTPFYEEAIKWLNPLVKRFKIRCIDNQNYGLIHQLLGKKKKLIISMDKGFGASDDRIQYLYCVLKYPAKKEEINFKMIDKMKGFSCHCVNMSIWDRISKLKPKMVEIHVTIKKDGTHLDDEVSYDFNELEKICKKLKQG